MNRNAASEPGGALDWNDLVRRVQSREDLAAFVRALAEHLREKPDDWENRDLSSFLEAMGAWVEEMEGYYRNRREPVPDQPTWKTLAEILLASKVYE